MSFIIFALFAGDKRWAVAVVPQSCDAAGVPTEARVVEA